MMMNASLRRVILLVLLRTTTVHAQNSPMVVSEVTVKHFDPMELIIRHHVGDGVFEFGLGHDIREVAALMHSVGQAGPLVAMEDLSPRRCKRGVEYEVGFVVSGEADIAIGPMFERHTYPACEAATVSVMGRLGLMVVYNDILRTWVRDNGYRADGPMLEVYQLSARDHATIEIRLPIRRDEAIPVSDDPSWFGAMMQSAEYEDVAEEIIPEWPAPTSDDRRWLGEIRDRLRVVVSVIKKNYSPEWWEKGENSPTTFYSHGFRDLLPAIIDRIEMMNEAEASPGPTVVGRDSTTDAVIGTERKAVLAELDKLIVRGHMKRLTADEFAKQTGDALRRIRGVLTRKPVQIEAPSADKSNEEAGEKPSTSDEPE